MKKNVGIIDRIVRIALVAVIVYAYSVGWVYGIVAMGLSVIALVLLTTAATGTCPLYTWLDLSTNRKKIS